MLDNLLAVFRDGFLAAQHQFLHARTIAAQQGLHIVVLLLVRGLQRGEWA